jgi:hypothetical protein
MRKIVDSPQLAGRVCYEAKNWEITLRAGILCANEGKPQAVISDQPFAAADQEVAIACLRN